MCLATYNSFFVCRIAVLWLRRLNIKARLQIPEFLTATLWSIHLIAFYLDWSWNIFFSHNFCLMLIKHLINLKKVRTKNLKFRTDLQDQVIDGWSVTHWVDECLQGQIAQKIIKSSNWSRTLAGPVKAGHWMAVKHCISFATLFGCKLCFQLIQNHARHSFQAFDTVAVLLITHFQVWADIPFLGQKVIVSNCFGYPFAGLRITELWACSTSNNRYYDFEFSYDGIFFAQF